MKYNLVVDSKMVKRIQLLINLCSVVVHANESSLEGDTHPVVSLSFEALYHLALIN